MTLPRGPEPHEWDRHMSAEDAMSQGIARLGLATWVDEVAHVEAIGTAVINAARELYGLSLAGADITDDIWLDTQGRMFDLVQQLPIDLVPAALLENRVAEVERREGAGTGAGGVDDRANAAEATSWVNRSADCPEAPAQARLLAVRSSSLAGLASLRDPWPHTTPCPEQCAACGCCIHSTLACSARDLPEGSLCGGVGCGCEGRS